jgi:hypothetical protein
MALMTLRSPDTRNWAGEAPARSAGRRTWAATAWLVAGTIAVAVTSYSLSLKVASERRGVERLARQNAALESDLKALDAELRVRMRMPQLQRWNDSVLGLVPISATQYVADPVRLAAYGKAPEAAPQQPRLQLAVRDIAPGTAPQVAAPAPRALLVSAEAPARQAPAARPAPAPAKAAAPTIARPAAEAPADLLQQVEMTFGTPQAPNP